MSKIKILLVIPNTSDPYCKNGYANYYAPHLGLAYIGAYLINKKIDVKIYDGMLSPSYVDLRRELEEFKPTHVGITAYTFNVKSAGAVASFIKLFDSDIKIILGGIHCTALPFETLSEFKFFDYAVIGEGEETLYAILKSNNELSALAKISGIAYSVKDKIIVQENKNNLEIDSLPIPAWNLFDLDRYKLPPFRQDNCGKGSKEFLLLTGRGCPYKCTFCYHPFGFTARMRSPENIIKEIQYLRDVYRVTYLCFATPTFTMDKEYTKSLCNSFIDNRLNEKISWACSTRIDLLDYDLIDLMQRAGCNSVILGLEVGEQSVLDNIQKKYNLNDVKQKIIDLKSFNIEVMSSFIIGLPGETTENINKTIEFACETKLDFATFNIFIPYPGTQIVKEINNSIDYEVLTNDWDEYRTQSGHYILKNKYISSKQIARLHRRAYLKFYFRKDYIGKLFKIVDWKGLLDYLFKKLKRNTILKGLYRDK